MEQTKRHKLKETSFTSINFDSSLSSKEQRAQEVLQALRDLLLSPITKHRFKLIASAIELNESPQSWHQLLI